MMSEKVKTPALLKISVFWNKVYDVIISADDVTYQNFSSDWNYIVDAFLWPKFGSSCVSMREVISNLNL